MWGAGITRNKSGCRWEGEEINTSELKTSFREAPHAKAELYEGQGEWNLLDVYRGLVV